MSDVLRLVTLPEREAEERTAYEDGAHSEAVDMLERALAMVKERKVSSVAIAFAFDDQAYGSLIPTAGNKMGHLIGAVADMQHRLLRRTNGED